MRNHHGGQGKEKNCDVMVLDEWEETMSACTFESTGDKRN